MRCFVLAAFATTAAANPATRPSIYGGNPLNNILSSLTSLLHDDPAESGLFAPITDQILKDYVEPIEVGRRH